MKVLRPSVTVLLALEGSKSEKQQLAAPSFSDS